MSADQCPYCHEWFFGGSHYCSKLPGASSPKAVPLRQLTEADVRRIVREELAKATKEQP